MKKGFTLIELVVILALFMVVALVAMSLLINMTNAFYRSQESSDLYMQVRLVSDFIRDEVRNATEVSLIAVPATFDNAYEYIYIQNNTIYHYENGNTVSKGTVELTEHVPMFTIQLTTERLNNITYDIEGTISNSRGTKVYNVDTTIHLNNIRQLPVESGQCIRYIKP
jgi:type II secretory pathway pseudopilin PulG